MVFIKSSFVIFLLLNHWTLRTSQHTPASSESDEDSGETKVKETSEQALNLKLLQTTERDQIGNLTSRLIEQFIEKVTDEIHSIERTVHDHKKNLVLSGWELLGKRLASSVALLENSKCSNLLAEKVRNVLIQGRGYIRNCAAVNDVIASFKEWVKFTFEMLQDLKTKFNTDSELCQNKQKKKNEECFLRLFHFNEDRKRQFRKDILQTFKDKADIATDNIEESWFMCTLRCTSAAKKMNAIFEKMIKLQLTDSDVFSDCDIFMDAISPTFRIRPHDSGLEPYFKEIKAASLKELDDPYQAYMVLNQ
ncbi:hypothetical protein LSTR_LSTR002487 [Laodelphax striatellus]|uniref:Uncharacterized protein n=1 Tax=Laodelphax striatellus TaxID=195883 RepID=A0A482X2T5_LAOST|nr:hypothetical protein LSTR_LSTR002487 [Laodelphax striatellus]